MNYGFNKKNHRVNEQRPSFTSEWKDTWIIKGPDREMIEFTNKWSKYMKDDGLTTSQLRNFFGEVIRIQSKGALRSKNDILMLKPKIAYAASKESSGSKEGLKTFKDIMIKALDSIIQVMENDKDFEHRFRNFHLLFESLLAYHKVHGGK
jgi:CRISPR-associated protein Csm2